MTRAIPPAGHPAAYDILVGLHVVCVVVGFGSVAISGAYGAIGRHAGRRPLRPETAVELRRFFATDSKLEYLLVAGPLFGVAAMAVRPGGSEFGAVWGVAGVVIWLVASALLLGVVRPTTQEIRVAGSAAADDDQAGESARLGAACRRLALAAGASDVLFVLALLMMVTQPR